MRLLSKSRKSEALAQLNECILEGRILENRYPEFKDHKFGDGGANMSVAALSMQLVHAQPSCSRS